MSHEEREEVRKERKELKQEGQKCKEIIINRNKTKNLTNTTNTTEDSLRQISSNSTPSANSSHPSVVQSTDLFVNKYADLFLNQSLIESELKHKIRESGNAT